MSQEFNGFQGFDRIYSGFLLSREIAAAQTTVHYRKKSWIGEVGQDKVRGPDIALVARAIVNNKL